MIHKFEMKAEIREERMFEVFEDNISYKNLIQLDSAFSLTHINYGKSPQFSGVDACKIASDSRKNKYSSKEKIENILDILVEFNGTEKNYYKKDVNEMWEYYWKEYFSVFEQLVQKKPYSVVTAYVGRHAIELGFKFLILCKKNKIVRTHDLGELAKYLISELDINCRKYDYMRDVDIFCRLYSRYIEGDNPEYFRYPEYKDNSYFAGNKLDIKWLSYNMALVILKSIKLAEDEGFI